MPSVDRRLPSLLLSRHPLRVLARYGVPGTANASTLSITVMEAMSDSTLLRWLAGSARPPRLQVVRRWRGVFRGTCCPLGRAPATESLQYGAGSCSPGHIESRGTSCRPLTLDGSTRVATTDKPLVIQIAKNRLVWVRFRRHTPGRMRLRWFHRRSSTLCSGH